MNKKNTQPDNEKARLRLSEGLRSTRRPFELAETPLVLVLRKAVEKRLDLLVPLSLGDAGSICNLEELGSYLG